MCARTEARIARAHGRIAGASQVHPAPWSFSKVLPKFRVDQPARAQANPHKTLLSSAVTCAGARLAGQRSAHGVIAVRGADRAVVCRGLLARSPAGDLLRLCAGQERREAEPSRRYAI